MLKRTLITLTALLSLAATGRAQEPQYAEWFAYDERIHDFGTIQEADGRVSHTFTFTNRGREAVSISGVRLGCSCTQADFDRQPIAPGKTARVTLTYDPSHRPGHFSKEAVVLLDGERRFTRVWIRGDVEPMRHPVSEDHPYDLGHGLWVSQTVITFPAMQPGSEDSVRVLIANATDRPMTIDFTRRPDVSLVDMPRRLVLQPDERRRLYVKYRARRHYSRPLRVDVTPVVNGQPSQPLRIHWLPNKQQTNSPTH